MLAIIMVFVVLIFDVNAFAGIGSGKHFQIFTTYAEVEKKAIEYAKLKDTFLGTLNRWRSNLLTDICNSPLEVRIEFCRKALHVDIFEFEFDFDHYEYLPCKQQNFWIKSPIPSEGQHFQVDMFLCPKIIYKNEETDEEAFLPYIFAASAAKSQDAALTFVRENTSNIIYPFQYIKGINFKKLKTRSEGDSSTILESVLRHIFSKSPRNNSPGLPLEEKMKSKIYEKFFSKFSSLNLCGLRRKYKISICRDQLQSESRFSHFNKLLVDGFDGKCRRRLVNTSNKNYLESNEMRSVVLCPSACVSLGTMVRVIESNLFYISSNGLKYSTKLFYRSNMMKGEKLQPLKSQNSQIQIAAQIRGTQRDRFIPYPSEEERMNRVRRKTTEEILKDMNSPQQTTVPKKKAAVEILKISAQEMQNPDPKSIKLFQAPWMAEDLIISLSQIKKSTRVYTRFMKTYYSINLYKLSDNERQKVCSAVTYIIGNKEQRSNNKFATFKVDWYRRYQLLLSVREIENLETNTFLMWECRFIPDISSYKYFVGKTLLRNTVVLYRSPFSRPEEEYVGNEIYTQGIITNIDEMVSIKSN